MQELDLTTLSNFKIGIAVIERPSSRKKINVRLMDGGLDVRKGNIIIYKYLTLHRQDRHTDF